MQVVKGVPAWTYTTEELVYSPRNLRSNRVYGFSPVEQVIMTVNIALRRQLSQLEYYTAGSIPDMVFGTPEEWNAEQVQAFQELWDSTLAGNSAERRRARFVPGSVKPYPLKVEGIKDQWDEWLSRIICFAFSISPQALIQQMNRATAQTAKQSSQEEGLEPLKLWWKSFMDDLLARCFGAPDLEFVYEDEEIADPAIKATVYSTLKDKGIVTADEAREAYGLPAMTPEQIASVKPPPPAFGSPFGGLPGKTEKEPEEKLTAPPVLPQPTPPPTVDAEKVAKEVASLMVDQRLFIPARMRKRDPAITALIEQGKALANITERLSKKQSITFTKSADGALIAHTHEEK
jgi:hypothetical protein